MATSTPDASSERSVRKPVASTVFSSRAMRPSSSRSATDPGPRSSASLAAASRSCSLFSGQTDVHSRSFSTRRNTFPEGSRGISSTNTTRLGRLYDASRSRDQRDQFVGFDRAAARRRRRRSASPSAASGTPKTAQSATAGWPCSTASISAGATWKPRTLIISLDAVGDPQPAVGVEVADVAGAVPPVAERLGGGVVRQIAGHRRVRAHLDLAGLARAHRLAGLERHDPHLDTRHRPGRRCPAARRRSSCTR